MPPPPAPLQDRPPPLPNFGDSLPPLNPTEPPFEPEPGLLYEAEDENGKWHAVVVTAELVDASGTSLEPKFSALAAGGSAKEVGLPKLREMLKNGETKKLAEEIVGIKGGSAGAGEEEEGSEEESGGGGEVEGGAKAVFAHKWRTVYKRYMRRIKDLPEPKGYR